MPQLSLVWCRHPDGSSEENSQETSLGVNQHSSNTPWQAGRCCEVETGPKWSIPQIKLSGPRQTITNRVSAQGRRDHTILSQSTNCGLFFLSMGITAEKEPTNTQTGCTYMFCSVSRELQSRVWCTRLPVLLDRFPLLIVKGTSLGSCLMINRKA